LIKFSKYFIPYVIILIILGLNGQILIAFLLAFLHELVHYFVARSYGYSAFSIDFLPIGAHLTLMNLDEASPQEDLIISFSGPAANILAAVIFCFISIYIKTDIISLLFKANLTLGLFNLLPLIPLDGGRILRDILSIRYVYKKGQNITILISIIIGTIMLLYSFILILNKQMNIGFSLISFFIVVSSVKEKERRAYLVMGDILKKKIRFFKKGYIENRSMSIYLEKDLLTALSLLDKYKYSIFHVVDKDMKFINIIYEEQILSGIREYGNITLKEYIELQ